jgi:signal transduction histidine kinase/ActR/RegA family two-component response regulator
MSIRIKVFLIITAIILVITASSVVISVSSAQNEIVKTLESGMQSVASVANEYISSEIELLLRDAATVVEALKGIPIESMHGVLIEQLAAYSDTFTSITIFNAAGNVDATYGRLPTPREMALGEYGQQAFEGRRVLSTTRQDSSGNVAFHVFVPMDESAFGTGSRSRIVALTVPGVFFSEKVNQFRERTGNIAIVDREGTIVANKNYDWVMNRQNFMGLVEKDSHYTDASKAFNRMIAGETGAERFYFAGSDSVSAFMPISGGQGWCITVTALIAESAFVQVRTLIIISGLIFLGLGMLAAAIASGSVAKPFYVIRDKNVELTKLRDALQAAQVAKTNFLANMSSDMRTPLNAVIGLSELSLTKKDVPKDVKGYLNRIYGSGLTLMEVVSDLLDISNMESGKFGVMAAEYDLPLFISDVVKANADHIGSKPLHFKIVPEDKLPARLIGDSLRIRQVFNNLLSNAFRYTSVGTVEWRISTEREGDTIWLVSSISDTGVGIKPENIDKLFRDYNNRMDDDARVRNLEGGASGLGLTLIKKIIDLMEGTITVESTWGKGSNFTVRIRQKYVSDEVIGAELLNSLKNYTYVEKKGRNIDDIQRVQLPGAKVLVVDDVEMNLEIAQGMMQPYGLAVDCLLNAQEAVEIVRRNEVQYSAIFISRWMSELDGKEAVRIIRNEIASDYAKTVPIIALTTNTVIGNKDIFHKWGFQDVLSKPLDVRHLDEVINTWIAPKAKK